MANDLNDTQPLSTSPGDDNKTQPSASTEARSSPPEKNAKGPAQKRRQQRKSGRLSAPWIKFGLLFSLVFLLLGTASASLGWNKGRGDFGATATIETGLYLFEQYNLALADIQVGQYELARQRLEFIFFENPEFLDVADKWVEVMLVLGQTSVPTDLALPTPSVTPTQDPRPKDDLLVAARSHVVSRQWTQAIDTLLALRKTDPLYQSAEVDGMLYLSLRNRGVQNILEFGFFELGLYDFTLSEQFGPLDGQALNYQEWARFYLYGNAFWLAYPQEAAYYYGQLVGLAPDLRDSNGLSAFYRYWQSLIHYGNQLALQDDWCETSNQYEAALAAGNGAELQVTADYAFLQCIALNPSATFTPTSTFTPGFSSATPTLSLSLTPTATPTIGGAASDTPTPTPSASSVAADTETPTPSLTPTDTYTPTNTPLPSDTPTETSAP